MDSDSNCSVDSDSSNFSIHDSSMNNIVGTAKEEEEENTTYMSYCRNCYKKIKNNIRKRFIKKGVTPFETYV